MFDLETLEWDRYERRIVLSPSYLLLLVDKQLWELYNSLMAIIQFIDGNYTNFAHTHVRQSLLSCAVLLVQGAIEF